MFLRHLVKNSKQIVVHLPAQKCDKGVIEAIQDKLHGQAQAWYKTSWARVLKPKHG